MFLAVVALSCGDDPPTLVAGTYKMNFLTGENGCMFEGWEVGNTLANVDVTLVQASGSAEVSGTVGGLVGLYLSGALGTNQLAGRVSGDTIEALLTASTTNTLQSCTYRSQLLLTGELAGDVMSGTLDLTVLPVSGDCAAYQNCHSVETFSGSRH